MDAGIASSGMDGRVYCEVYFYFFYQEESFSCLNSTKILSFVLVNCIYKLLNLLLFSSIYCYSIYSNEAKCKKGIQGPNIAFSNKA